MQNCAILGRSISFNINKLTISDMLGVRVVARSNRVAPTIKIKGLHDFV